MHHDNDMIPFDSMDARVHDESDVQSIYPVGDVEYNDALLHVDDRNNL